MAALDRKVWDVLKTICFVEWLNNDANFLDGNSNFL